MRGARIWLALLAAVAAMAADAASAQDRLKIAVGGRGIGETFITEVGYNAGLFKKHKLELEIFYTDGGGETARASRSPPSMLIASTSITTQPSGHSGSGTSS